MALRQESCVQNQSFNKFTSHGSSRNATTSPASFEPASHRSTEDVGDGRPGWQMVKVASGALAAAFACGFVVRRDWLPAKVIMGAVGAIGAVLALGTRSRTVRAAGAGAMAWTAGQLGLGLIDDVMRRRLRAQVAGALRPTESTSLDGLPPDALERAFARARAKLAILGLCRSQSQARASPAASWARHRATSLQGHTETSIDDSIHRPPTAHVSATPYSQEEIATSPMGTDGSWTTIADRVGAATAADRAAVSSMQVELASEFSRDARPTWMELARVSSQHGGAAQACDSEGRSGAPDSTVGSSGSQPSPTANGSPMAPGDRAGTATGAPRTSLDRTIHTSESEAVRP
jgi:hypothetical protein